MILIADVDVKRQDVLTEMLGAAGHAVACVSSAKELVRDLKTSRPKLILLNPNLPGFGSRFFDFLKKVREKFDRKNLSVIVLATEYQRSFILEALKLGANELIRLPLDADMACSQILSQLELVTSGQGSSEQTQRGSDTTIKVIYKVSNTAQFFLTSDSPNPHYPCRLPVRLTTMDKTLFCQTLYLSRKEIQLRVNCDVPQGDSLGLYMGDLVGGEVGLTCKELKRDTFKEGGSQYLRILVSIQDASSNFEDLLQRLAGVSNPIDEAKQQPSTENKDPQQVAIPEKKTQESVKYHHERMLGQGSFASVFLVRDLALKRPVAMKVLNAKLSRFEGARTKFLEEAQIAAQFLHPNIVSIYEMGELDASEYGKHLKFPPGILEQYPQRLTYFTMEYVEGVTLRYWMDKNRNATEKSLLEIMLQILKAIAFAHEKKVIHRDIKPENILITPDFHVKVMDFGIATAHEKDAVSSSGNPIAAACTPQYASPEQLTGKKLNSQSDLYSFGAVAYEMLAGEAPFEGCMISELIHEHEAGNMPPSPEMHPVLSRIILGCLAKSSEDRYKSAEEIIELLQEYLDDMSSGRNSGVRSALAELVRLAHDSEEQEEAAEALNKLLTFLKTFKTHQDRILCREIRDQLSSISTVDHLIDHNLNEQNIELLFKFFSELGANHVVPHLMTRFRDAHNSQKKCWIGELALSCAGEDLMLLLEYGMELSDSDASVLVRCFANIHAYHEDAIFLKWARHHGFRTQMELLRILREITHREVESLNILNYFANQEGTLHPRVRELAELMLQSCISQEETV